MKACTELFEVATHGKGTYEITDEVSRIVRNSGIKTGVMTVFIQHTSALYHDNCRICCRLFGDFSRRE